MHSEFEEDIRSGSREVRKISKIVDQFSATLKPLNLKKEKFLLGDLVADITESIDQAGDKPNVEIEYREEKPAILFADKALVGQALLNILQNSLHATEKGKIVIRGKKQRKKIHITVQDTGKGMSKEETSRAFEPFFTGKKEGMGIGLYLTQKIIEAHEGEITCESHLGKGTLFSIWLPGG
jgi:two-component system NtrC family sensor kinase